MTKPAFIAAVVTLWSLGVFNPPMVFGQHGPGRHGSGSTGRHDAGSHEAPTYDVTREATFKGTVANVKSGRSVLHRLLQIHTMGVAGGQGQEKRVVLDTDVGALQIHLGPTKFLAEQKLEIRKGDTLEVTGSRITMGESQMVLAREIRKGDNAWALRDATGQPLWAMVPTEARGFWTKKKVFLAVAVAKVVALATVLRH